jgi:hypothetical protein
MSLFTWRNTADFEDAFASLFGHEQPAGRDGKNGLPGTQMF